MNEITIVGCGVMGSALINAMMIAGFDVNIVDINEDAAKPFVERGASYAKDLNGSKETEAIILNLPSHPIAKSVIEAADKPRLKDKILIDTTTGTPAEVKSMKMIADERDMIFLDGKIAHYPPEVGPDTGYLVYSGNKAAFDKTENILNSMGKAVFLGEEITRAAVLDLAVLAVHFGAFATLVESAAFSIKNNYPIPQLVEQTKKILPIMLAGNLRSIEAQLSDYTGEFDDANECALEIETHAVEAIINAFNADGVKAPISEAIHELFESGVKNGYGKKDMIAVIEELI